jgi:hypothetical protein
MRTDCPTEESFVVTSTVKLSGQAQVPPTACGRSAQPLRTIGRNIGRLAAGNRPQQGKMRVPMRHG